MKAFSSWENGAAGEEAQPAALWEVSFCEGFGGFSGVLVFVNDRIVGTVKLSS